jgi:precorrin-3B C17-methyltransferase
MTFRAREALTQSDVIVGYETYIKLIKGIISGKEIVSGGMGGEMERMKKAIELAESGKTVSVACSGDSGIYGMAGLVGEITKEKKNLGLEMEIVPGVPSLVSSAALLGAPLTGDFVTISLSDYLVPWEDIVRRLETAAQGNFVIVIYNPRSKHRKHQLAEARQILLRYQEGSTAVGIVSNAYRLGQQVIVTNLDHMLDFEIGMTTTIIVGNSTTFICGDWMVTPRGYGTKYRLDGEA